MARVNEHYLKLKSSYLFSEIARRVREFQNAHPDARIIRLGIGDVTQPLPPSVIRALHEAVDEMARAETFRGYGPEPGYEFLTELIAKHDYGTRGASHRARRDLRQRRRQERQRATSRRSSPPTASIARDRSRSIPSISTAT